MVIKKNNTVIKKAVPKVKIEEEPVIKEKPVVVEKKKKIVDPNAHPDTQAK